MQHLKQKDYLKHLRGDGVGLRQFVDWLLLLHTAGDQLDHAQLKRDLKRFHLLDAWQVLGGILVWQLGLPEKEFPLWNARKARHSQGHNLQYILCFGNFGDNLEQYKDYYHLPPSLRRDLLAFRYVCRYQYFLYRLLPYDSTRVAWNFVKKVLRSRFKNFATK